MEPAPCTCSPAPAAHTSDPKAAITGPCDCDGDTLRCCFEVASLLGLVHLNFATAICTKSLSCLTWWAWLDHNLYACLLTKAVPMDLKLRPAGSRSRASASAAAFSRWSRQEKPRRHKTRFASWPRASIFYVHDFLNRMMCRSEPVTPIRQYQVLRNGAMAYQSFAEFAGSLAQCQ